MAQMQRFIGVGRGVLYHHQRAVLTGLHHAVVRLRGDVLQHASPVGGFDSDVQKALDDIEFLHGRLMGHQIVAYLLGSHVGCLVRDFEKWKHHDGLISLKLLFCGLWNYLTGRKIHTIKRLDGLGCRQRKNVVNRHNVSGFNRFYQYVFYHFYCPSCQVPRRMRSPLGKRVHTLRAFTERSNSLPVVVQRLPVR